MRTRKRKGRADILFGKKVTATNNNLTKSISPLFHSTEKSKQTLLQQVALEHGPFPGTRAVTSRFIGGSTE